LSEDLIEEGNTSNYAWALPKQLGLSRGFSDYETAIIEAGTVFLQPCRHRALVGLWEEMSDGSVVRGHCLQSRDCRLRGRSDCGVLSRGSERAIHDY